jgi:SpoVK/Ycf46/Vps4 family AAA+-type ATPase
VLAHDLDLDLYKADLSGIVSKYIGETEKNLRRLFDAAESGGGVLFIDEADALLGKRTEVRDSHDRFANIQIDYLLQRMETYQGVAILATNMRSALDFAFLRRLRFIVEFPFPDAHQRAAIWRTCLPDAIPGVKALDLDALAALPLNGGMIRNVAVNAAFLAAADRIDLNHDHLLQAVRAEFAKLQVPISERQLAGEPVTP